MRWFVLPICCFIAIILACGGVGLEYERRLVGSLGLVACDTKAQMAICDFDDSSWPRVGPTVFAVGWNHSHIIAKIHPADRFDKMDKSITQYFIITVRDRKVYGPFDEPEFVLHCDILGVSEKLQFTLTFREVE